VNSAAGRKLTAEYVHLIQNLAENGARIVVLPEKGFRATPSTLSEITTPLASVAVDHHVDVILGIMMEQGQEEYQNMAIALSGSGLNSTEYVKHHLIPGLEDDFITGKELAFVPGSNPSIGIIICKDLDFPKLVRSYRNSGVPILVAPAWDFHSDGWLHSRMALIRSIESGLAIARNGRDGQLTISDGVGRILAEKVALENTPATIIADVPTGTPRTFYSRVGDWLAWSCITFSLIVSGWLFYSSRLSRSRDKHLLNGIHVHKQSNV
jgi:apolipoprotein N-acyltransferase